MSDALKPCPFCGAAPEQPFKTGILWRICCSGEECTGEISHDTQIDAIEAWNRRAPEVVARRRPYDSLGDCMGYTDDPCGPSSF